MFVYILSLKSPSFIHHQSVSSVWAHETHLCLHNVLAFKFSPSFSSCFVFFHFLIFKQINIRYIWRNVQIQKTEIFFLFTHLIFLLINLHALYVCTYLYVWWVFFYYWRMILPFIKGSLCLAFHHNALSDRQPKNIRI